MRSKKKKTEDFERPSVKILVLNCGSSSVKFRLYKMPEEDLLAEGLVERLAVPGTRMIYRKGDVEIKRDLQARNHGEAIDVVLKILCDPQQGCIHRIEEIDAIGHRVVHGGETFTSSVLINEAVLSQIQQCSRFAPLHNPPNIEGIHASLWLIPFARQIAVFDTAFHQTMEPQAFIYAVPYAWYEQKGIRRYGFHGTSHRYVAYRAAEYLGKPVSSLKIVTCHLGNGSSVTAVKDGKSVDTSMGFTPLEGLIMGTRCGDLDPAILLYMMAMDGHSPAEMDNLLNKKSGLLGITGGDSDLRIIESKAKGGSERHQLALRLMSTRVKKYVGAYAAVMGGLDALVFTAGIGENSATVRAMICENMEFLGIEIDIEKNTGNAFSIHRGITPVLVIPTNEELAIAEEVMKVLNSIG